MGHENFFNFNGGGQEIFQISRGPRKLLGFDRGATKFFLQLFEIFSGPSLEILYDRSLRTRLIFSLLMSLLTAVRGVGGKQRNVNSISSLVVSLVEQG